MTRENRFLLMSKNEKHAQELNAWMKKIFPKARIALEAYGQVGLEVVRTFVPDVVLVAVPSGDPGEMAFCRRLKRDSGLKGIPILLITDSPIEQADRIQALACGIDGMMTWPVDVTELNMQVNTLLKVNENKRAGQAQIQQLHDLTRQQKDELRLLRQKHMGLIDDLPALISEHLPDTTLTYVNQRYCDLHKMAPDDLIGMKFIDLIPQEAHEDILQRIDRLTPQKPTGLLLRKREMADGIQWMEWRNRGIFNDEGSLVQVVSVGVDITERKGVESRLVYLSYHDHLTGLYNRRFFEEEMKRLDRTRNLPITVVNADVNGLKIVNDSFGHHKGDLLLKNIADAMKKGFRADDIVARIGGDEFAIILPKTDADQAKDLLARVKEELKQKSGGIILQSVAFGYETKVDDQQSMDGILTQAEDQMYRHKLYESASMRSKVAGVIMNSLFEKSERELTHSLRVGDIAASIAEIMGFSDGHVKEVRVAGYIHDIGKIGVKEKILNKAGKLTDEEWIEMKHHPEAGSRILSSVPEYKTIADYILAHHERFDGLGYPGKLAGDAIPIEARIISVADAFDAMTAERSYRHAIGKEEATLEIVRSSGSQFDPLVVGAFLRIDVDRVHQADESKIFQDLMDNRS